MAGSRPRWHVLGVVAVGLVAVAAAFGTEFLSQGATTPARKEARQWRTESGVDMEISEDVQNLLHCGYLCKRGFSAQDRSFAEQAAKKPGSPSIEKQLPKVCFWRCRSGRRTYDEDPGADPPEHYRPPKDFWIYRELARNCARAAAAGPTVVTEVSRAVAALRQCGVVHVASLLDLDFLKRLSSAWEEFRSNPKVFSQYSDHDRLRDGRTETWIPFKSPFNDSSLLKGEKIKKLLKEYWPDQEPILDHVSVITAAPGAAAQPIHADVQEPGEHLEVHIPLVPVGPELGATQFCPHTQGMAFPVGAPERKGGAGQAQVAQLRFIMPAKICEADAYVRYAGAGFPFGTATFYDAAMYHGGGAVSANATVERPVLQLSYTASAAAREKRGYPEHAFRKDLASREMILKHVERYRSA